MGEYEKVYIVMECLHFEEVVLVSVHSSLEGATKAKEDLESKANYSPDYTPDYACDAYTIEEHEVRK